ncbi:unnamed protein product [Victoria cruziana]
MLDKVGEFCQDKVIEEFEEKSRDAGKVQERTLWRILHENGQSEYLQKCGLGGRTDPRSYRACVPLVTHADLEPYIQRIVNGENKSVLTEKPISTISLSSGTTQGRPKFLPFNDELVDNTMQLYRTSFAYRNREFPIKNGRALQFIYGSKQFKTEGGLLAGTATTNVYNTDQFKATMKDIMSQSCSPDEVIFGADYKQSLYCHLLCGLIYSDEVQFITSTFAHGIVHAFRTFEQVWEELCEDIKEGVLSSQITIPSMRTAVSKILKPRPDLAATIRRKCSSLNNWYGLVPQLWPNAKYIYGIMTGSMEPYLKKLRHYAGDLPLLSSDYGSSEGWVGANVNPRASPEETVFTVLPDIGYFEFIPLKREVGSRETDPSAALAVYNEFEPVGLAEVKVGEEYEVVVTNFAGLYRYRLGDVVKIKGFYNSIPQLQFICRRSLLLTVNMDKNTEKDLQLAVERAAELLAKDVVELVDFTSYVDMASDPGHYVVFWELSQEASEATLQDCCCSMDRSFLDAGYVSSRKSKTIGALELKILRRGTFHRILDHYLNLGSAVSQFKMPRCIGASNKAVLEILKDSVLKSYRSTAFG